MNHLQWGALLQPAINGTHCRIISTANGHIDGCEVAPRCRSWRGPHVLCPSWLQTEWKAVSVVFRCCRCNAIQCESAASWANTWSHWVRSAGSVQSPALLLHWPFWCVSSAARQEEFNPALVIAMKSWMTLKIVLQWVVVVTLGYLTVQKAYSNSVRQIIHCYRTFFRKSLERRQKKINRFWRVFRALGEFISTYCFHYWFCLCYWVCDVLTSITSILDIPNLTTRSLSDKHIGIQHRRPQHARPWTRTRTRKHNAHTQQT